MAKVSGLGATVTVDDGSGSPQTITNDVTEFSISTPVALQDTTGVDKSAHERLPLLADGSVSLKGVFNAASNLSHVVFNTIPLGVARTTKIIPSVAAHPFLAMEILYTDYGVARSSSGELTWTAPGDLQDGTVPSWTNS
jgi:hypothetical protein